MGPSSSLSQADKTWLTNFIRDQFTQNQLAPQAQAKVGTHTVEDLVVNGSVDLSNLSTNQLQLLRAQLGMAKVTVQNLSSGPPTNPVDGDIWVAANVDATAHIHWQFVYHSGDTYPWKFIGGAALFAQDTSGTARQNTLATTWQAVTGLPVVTLTRAGQYEMSLGGTVTTAGNASCYLGFGVNGVNMYSETALTNNDQAASSLQTATVSRSDVTSGTARAAGDTVGAVMYSDSPAAMSVQWSWLRVTPIAVQ